MHKNGAKLKEIASELNITYYKVVYALYGYKCQKFLAP